MCRMAREGRKVENFDEQVGYLYVLRKRTLMVTHPNARQQVIDTPSILFFPRPTNTVFTAQRKKALNSSARPSNSAPEC